MQVAFATKQLRQVCESQVRAERQLGVGVATALQRRLADIVAAGNARDLVAGQPRVVPGSPHEELVLQLADNFEVILKANHNSVAVLENGAVDWAQVTRVQVMSIEEVVHA